MEDLHKVAATHWINVEQDAHGTVWASCSDTGDTREHCGERWRVHLKPSGKPYRFWWACPNDCNMSEQLAISRLNAMRDGRAEFDAAAVRRYYDFLMSLRTPKRRAFSFLDHEAINQMFTAEQIAEVVEAFTGEWDEEAAQEWGRFK